MLAVASNREQPNTLYSGIKGVRGRIVKFYESDTLSARSGVILPLRHVFSVGILFSIRVTCLASKRSIGTLHSEIRINENVRGPSNNRHKFFFKFFYKPHFLCITFRGTKLTIQFFFYINLLINFSYSLTLQPNFYPNSQRTNLSLQIINIDFIAKLFYTINLK